MRPSQCITQTRGVFSAVTVTLFLAHLQVVAPLAHPDELLVSIKGASRFAPTVSRPAKLSFSVDGLTHDARYLCQVIIRASTILFETVREFDVAPWESATLLHFVVPPLMPSAQPHAIEVTVVDARPGDYHERLLARVSHEFPLMEEADQHATRITHEQTSKQTWHHQLDRLARGHTPEHDSELGAIFEQHLRLHDEFDPSHDDRKRYLIWQPPDHATGLGNLILSFVSSFVLSYASKRQMLVDFSTSESSSDGPLLVQLLDNSFLAEWKRRWLVADLPHSALANAPRIEIFNLDLQSSEKLSKVFDMLCPTDGSCSSLPTPSSRTSMAHENDILIVQSNQYYVPLLALNFDFKKRLLALESASGVMKASPSATGGVGAAALRYLIRPSPAVLLRIQKIVYDSNGYGGSVEGGAGVESAAGRATIGMQMRLCCNSVSQCQSRNLYSDQLVQVFV